MKKERETQSSNFLNHDAEPNVKPTNLMKGKGERAYVPQACFVTVNVKLFDYKH